MELALTVSVHWGGTGERAGRGGGGEGGERGRGVEKEGE